MNRALCSRRAGAALIAALVAASAADRAAMAQSPAQPAAPEPAQADEPEQADPDDAEPPDDQDEQAGEVIVIDSRTEKPLGEAVGAVEVVDRDAIRARGARNVSDALRGRIGLEVVPALRGTAIRAQGMDPSYVLILIDGLPAIGRVDGALDLDRLPVGGVERIEVMKGPSSALYGSDALGGVINVVTRDADRPLTAEASAVVGSRDRLDASATAAGRRDAGGWRLSSRAALGMRRADGYDLDTSTPHTDGSAEKAGDGALRVAAARGPWRFTAGGDYLRQDLESVDSTIVTEFDRRTVGENGAATASASFQPEPATSVALTLRHSIFRDQFLLTNRRDGTFEYEETRERMTTAALVATRLLTPAHLLTGGLDGSAEGLTSDRLPEDGSRERLGIYAQDEWLVVRRPQIILVPGARLDMDTQFGLHPTPKLGARWDATDRIIVRASAGLGYRAPDFRQLHLRFENPTVGYTVEGNPDLDPETSVGGNLSIEVEPVARLAIAVQGYWNEVDDLIAISQVETDEAEQLFRYDNIASARTRGVEVQARARLSSYLTATAGYALSDTLDREADRELPDRARHRGSFELRAQPIERVTLATHGEVVGRRVFFIDREMDYDRRPAKRYAWLGARAEVGILDQLSLFAGVDNIADAGDTDFLPIAPRTFYAGLRGHYETPDEPVRPARP